jgi:tetratricopeptide (TPR) repeat protein
LIPGNDPSAWLREMSAWEIPLARLRLLILPKSLSDRQASGVLVLFDGEDPSAMNIAPTAVPYFAIARRLFIPVDAQLFPEISAAELHRILIHEINVLHPSAGLIGFSAGDIRRVADLIQAPIRRAETWNAAKAGAQTAPRLLSVESDSPPTLAEIMDSGREDIGSLGDATRKEFESPPQENFASKITGPLMRLLEWMTGKISAGKSAASRGISEKLEQARRGELNRLLEMLEKNPDQGLQYAIPLNSPAMRGLAQPTGKLAPRPADFDLRRLRGATPADPWNVPWQIRQQLLEQYRAAANRELALGRHRRAAYIFAELLGDFAAAAHALRAGRHTREAAALFRDPLRNFRAAAECLAEAGLLIEAVAIYEELKDFVGAGQIYEKLERAEDARRCYRAAVESYLLRNEILAAAGLLEKQLQSPLEALQLLGDAWPARDPSGLCLAESFELCGRLGKHATAADRVRILSRQPVAARHVLPLAQTLSGVSRLYPDAEVRTAAADATRVVAGNYLASPAGETGDNAALLQTIVRIEPHDRLLARDVSRFSRQIPPRPRPYPLAKPRTKEPELIISFTLGLERVETARAHGGVFYAIGNGLRGRTLMRGNFRRDANGLVLSDASPFSIHLSPCNPPVILISDDGDVLDSGLAVPINKPSDLLGKIGCPAWLSRKNILALSFSEQDVAHVLDNSNGLAISAFTILSGQLLSRWTLEIPVEDLHVPRSMIARKGHVFFIGGGGLFEMSSPGTLTQIPLPHAATALMASPPFTRVRIAVAMTEGIMVIWPDGGQQLIGDLLIDPVAAFLKNGTLLVMTADAGRAYRTGGGNVAHIASFSGAGQRPVAILPGEQEDTFAVLTVDGKVNVYRAEFA